MFTADLSHDLAVSFLGPYPREMRASVDPDWNAHNYRSMLITAKRWKQPRCHPPWMDEQDIVYP